MLGASDGYQNWDTSNRYPGGSGGSGEGFSYYPHADLVYRGGSPTSYGSGGASTNMVIGVALDLDEGKVWFAKNSTWQESGDPKAGTNPALSSIVGSFSPSCSVFQTDDSATMVFAETDLTYTPPAGFKSLCTANLPEPTVKKSSTVAEIVLREGAGGNRTTSGTGTVSASSNSYPPASDAFWEPNNNYIQFVGNVGNWLEYTFNAPTVCDEFYFQYRNLSGGWAPYDFKVQAHDGNDWVDLTDEGTMLKSNGYTVTLSSTNTTAYTRYRMFITGGSTSYCDLGYAEFRTTKSTVILPDMSDFDQDGWINTKNRDYLAPWQMYDTSRGATKSIQTSNAYAESTRSSGLTAFNSTGYELGTSISENQVGKAFIDLCLKAGAKQGFEIVTYTGNGVAGRQVAHSLGKKPTFIVVKRLDAEGSWMCYHTALGATKYVALNLSQPASANVNDWNDTEPTSTVFTLGIDNIVNGNGGSFVAYLFTDSDIFKAFSYTGNGVADGPFVNLGGRPLAIPFLKDVDKVNNWMSYDSARNPFNPVDNALYSGLSNAESPDTHIPDFTSQGFKIASTAMNDSNHLHVGLAILESTKYSNAY